MDKLALIFGSKEKSFKSVSIALALILLLAALASPSLEEGGLLYGILVGSSSNHGAATLLRGIANFILALGGSVLAAVLVPIAATVWAKALNHAKWHALQRLFSIPEDGRIVFVLPKFEIAEQCSKMNACVNGFDGGKENSPDKRIKHLDNRALSFYDVVAAREIGELFGSFGFHKPRIQFDEDVYDYFNKRKFLNVNSDKFDEIRRADTFILIGLTSNHMSILVGEQRWNSSYFRFCPGTMTKDDKPRVVISGSPEREDLVKFWDDPAINFESSEDGACALFSKSRGCLPGSDREVTFVLIGGGTGRATRKLASHLRKNWYSLAKLTQGDKKKSLSDGFYSVVFSLSDKAGSKVVKKADCF
ncbi:hypothetical protein [Zoogloea sp. 1C4]|uniref:hypothetical protein n=1 Tax=Zoogloea sp. 1C4 TaxID=2570190 RepID=UPI001291B5C2|nr:hypothetical protein [Zoogloea sp. 1C4]